MESASGVTRSITDELHSWDIPGDKMGDKSLLVEVSLTNFIVGISKEIKWKVKVMLPKYH